MEGTRSSFWRFWDSPFCEFALSSLLFSTWKTKCMIILRPDDNLDQMDRTMFSVFLAGNLRMSDINAWGI